MGNLCNNGNVAKLPLRLNEHPISKLLQDSCFLIVQTTNKKIQRLIEKQKLPKLLEITALNDVLIASLFSFEHKGRL